MASLATYYLLISFLFVCVAVYNAFFYSKFSGDKCQIQQFDESADGTPTSTTKISSIQLATIPIILCIIYAIIIFFTLLGVLGIKKFEAMNPERFRKLGCCLGTLGCYVRNLTLIIKIFHIIIGVIIVVQYILIFGTSDCDSAKHFSPSYPKGQVGLMRDESILQNNVTAIVWATMHFICPCFKKFMNQQSYIYEPFDSDKSYIRYLCCDLFGP